MLWSMTALLSVVLAAGQLAVASPAAADSSAPVRAIVDTARAPVDTPTTRRPRAIEYSDWYNTRLTIHRIGSYAMLPLFGAEWSLGQNLIQDRTQAPWMRQAHKGVAGAIAVLFGVNTLTGAWNLWDSRADPNGRTRRFLHTAAMLGSDAGFMWDGATGGGARRSLATARTHRAIAIGSIGLSAAGTAMMWFWRN
jgi:hypothetical protein